MNGILLLAVAYVAGAMASRSLFASPPVEDRTLRESPPTDRERYRLIATRSPFRDAPVASESLSRFRFAGTARQGAVTFAAIEDRTTRQQRLYRRGDRLIEDQAESDESRAAPAWRVARISPREVLLASAEGTATLARTERGAVQRSPSPQRASRGNVRESPRENEYLIDRRDVVASLDNFGETAQQIRAVPNFVDGRSTGYRVFGIKHGTLFQRLGLRNGDVIRGINAVSLEDPGRALALLRDLRRERRITLDVQRGHRERTLTYEIR